LLRLVAAAVTAGGLAAGSAIAPPVPPTAQATPGRQYLVVGGTLEPVAAVLAVNGPRMTRVGRPVHTGAGFSLGAVPHPSGKFVYFTGYSSGSLRGYRLHDNGRLTPVPGAFTHPGGPVVGISFTPDGRFLFAAAGTSFTTEMLTYSVAPSGALTLRHRTIVPGPVSGMSIPVTSPDGRHLFVPSWIQGTMDSYRIGPSGSLSRVGTQQWSGIGPALPSVSPNGRYLYITNEGLQTISGWRVGRGGALTPVGMFWAGLGPHGLAIHPNSRYVYFPIGGQFRVEGRRILPGGALAPLPGGSAALPFGHAPSRVVLSPDGKWLYAIGASLPAARGSVTAFRVLPSGALRLAGGPIDIGIMANDGATAYLATPPAG
ncbi:beta-propeller fold lactonase family protein, partial [Gordonia sp. (in: high G+C Gram-positive bacteria)]|uniref:beta-propeller fold lactonase family protein n=1 Tax=Gordonia sp. (in: high G+C Gram-positive bacteria) TaxID=84139 RepID=UPI0039E2CD46